MNKRIIVPLHKWETNYYASGTIRKTFKYVKAFVIDFKTGPEVFYVPCRRNGDELYTYPYGLVPSALSLTNAEIIDIFDRLGCPLYSYMER